MDFGTAVKRPFTDWKKLLIGMALYVVPFLSLITGIFAGGYLLRCLQSSMKGNHGLPEWEQWGDLFVKGLLMFVITLLYALPAIILLLIFAGAALGGLAAPNGVGNLGKVFAALGFMVFVFILLILLVAYIVPAALLRFAHTEKFGDAFSLGAVFRIAFTGPYVVAWLLGFVAGVIGGIIMILLFSALAVTIVLPFIIMAFFQFCIGIMSMTLFGMAGAELQGRQ